MGCGRRLRRAELKTYVVKLVSFLLNIIGLDDSREDRKAVLRVQRAVKVVTIDTRQVDLITRLERHKA